MQTAGSQDSSRFNNQRFTGTSYELNERLYFVKKRNRDCVMWAVTCVSNVKQQPSEGPEKSVQSAEKFPGHLVELYHRSKSCIGQEHEGQLIELLTNFQDVFSSGPDDFGSTDVTTHKIDVGDATPIKQPARRVPLKQREEVNVLLEEMRSQGVIEPSQSPWSSPVVLVQKKDGSKRFCVDYRKLNEVTKRDCYPLPRVDTTLDAINGSSWFSTLDLKSGYGQVKMAENDKEKTAFTAGEGLWQFTVMPFGLANAPATFERLMEQILQGLPWTVCLVYLDDVIVHAKTLADEFENLRTVFQRLRQAGLKLSPRKCHFFQKSVRYLGHVVSESGIAVDPEKTIAVSRWPEPRNKTEVRSFLGLSTYYRRFIPHFADVARPLQQLTEKDREFSWTEECQGSFENLKQLLTLTPILAYPNVTDEFCLDTDASDYAIGDVLSQKQNGQERVVAYFSRTLTRSERNYCVTRKELLAVVKAIEHFNYYLYGQKFRVRTDHSALQWLMSFREPQGQLTRWVEKLQIYDFTVEHRSGSEHKNADALSRRPCADGTCKQCDRYEERFLQEKVARVSKADVLHVKPCGKESEKNEDDFVEGAIDWKEKQGEDDDMTLIIKALKEKQTKPEWNEIAPCGDEVKTLWAQWDSLRFIDGILYRVWEDSSGKREVLQVVVPTVLRKQIFGILHDSKTGGHFGINKTIGKIRMKFYWPKLRDDVKVWCAQCDVCAARKGPSRKIKAPLATYVVGLPMERVAIHVLGPLPVSESGNRYILIAMDYFTKWPEAYALPNQEAETVAKVLVDQFVSRFGTPAQLHSDQGRNFESQVFTEMCKLLGIEKTRTTPLHPQSDGMVERYNRTLEHQIAMFVNENQKDWDQHISLLLMAYRTATHESTGLTPAKLMMGRELRVPLDLLMGTPPELKQISKPSYVEKLKESLSIAHNYARQRLRITTERMKTRYNLDATATRLVVGTQVWLYRPRRKKDLSPKLSKNWVGPYVIVKRINDLVYRIQLTDRCKPMVVHRNRLRRYVGESMTLISSTQNDKSEGGPQKQQRRSNRERKPPDRFKF